MFKLCFNVQILFFNLFSKNLASLWLGAKIFNTMKFCQRCLGKPVKISTELYTVRITSHSTKTSFDNYNTKTRACIPTALLPPPPPPRPWPTNWAGWAWVCLVELPAWAKSKAKLPKAQGTARIAVSARCPWCLPRRRRVALVAAELRGVVVGSTQVQGV